MGALPGVDNGLDDRHGLLTVSGSNNSVIYSGTDAQVVLDRTVNAFRATPGPAPTT